MVALKDSQSQETVLVAGFTWSVHGLLKGAPGIVRQTVPSSAQIKKWNMDIGLLPLTASSVAFSTIATPVRIVFVGLFDSIVLNVFFSVWFLDGCPFRKNDLDCERSLRERILCVRIILVWCNYILVTVCSAHQSRFFDFADKQYCVKITTNCSLLVFSPPLLACCSLLSLYYGYSRLAKVMVFWNFACVIWWRSYRLLFLFVRALLMSPKNVSG